MFGKRKNDYLSQREEIMIFFHGVSRVRGSVLNIHSKYTLSTRGECSVEHVLFAKHFNQVVF